MVTKILELVFQSCTNIARMIQVQEMGMGIVHLPMIPMNGFTKTGHERDPSDREAMAFKLEEVYTAGAPCG